ncbi:MAG: hypothetical protein M3P91_06100 [Actinomycetota bacterium]|nr:hypothetical protein [Actinomycetota bacterium]
MVGERSALGRAHPDWLVRGVTAGRLHNEVQHVLDVTVPAAARYLCGLLESLREQGFDFFTLELLYAGALDGDRAEGQPGGRAYRRGMALIRNAVGPGAYLVGRAAPMLPSIGWVDAMQVAPDVRPAPETDGRVPAGGGNRRAAMRCGIARAWQHGRFWINDSGCLLTAPGVERREEWAKHVETYGGLRCTGDRLRSLDSWGLETTRRLLSDVPPPEAGALGW